MNDPIVDGSAANTPPQAFPEKAELEREQVYLANQKTKIEIRKLEQDATPEKWWLKLVKNVVALGGILTVAATGYGIWDSYTKTIEDRNRARIDRERTRSAEERIRFEDAIKRLETSGTISKLVGVSVLSGYLNPSSKQLHRQILFTLAGLMATEKDFQTQAAVIDLITAIPKDGSIAKEDWAYFQEILTSQSRALMLKGGLPDERQFGTASALPEEEKSAKTLAKLIALTARKGVVANYANYGNIYCVECDFRGVDFPPNANFTGAILDRANFNGTKLENAVFDNAELIGVTFIRADARGAKFRSLDDTKMMSVDTSTNKLPLGRTRYLDRAARALDANAMIKMTMPNFSCANLENANFDRHALFPGVFKASRAYATKDQKKPKWLESIPSYLKDDLTAFQKIEFSPATPNPPKFFKSNLKGAKLDLVRFFSLSTPNDLLPLMNFSQQEPAAELVLLQGNMSDDAFKLPGSKLEAADNETRGFQSRMRGAFYLADFEFATLPDNLGKFLKLKKPTESDYRSTYQPWGFFGFAFQEEDLDKDCIPRKD